MPTLPAPGLEAIVDHVTAEPGLIANIVAADIQGGADAAALMNGVIAQAIAATGVNTDGILTPNDLRAISDYIRADPSLYDQFVIGHGDDEGSTETGFHLVQGDGGAYRFQGRDFVDTIGDAIYHVGFEYQNGRFRNEDGDANEEVADVAGWLNYFVNGENRVYGTDGAETLSSGHYSFALADAADEIFSAGGGDDMIWAGAGDDAVYGGTGHDRAGGGTGNDTIRGEAGTDTLAGDEGDDLISGGSGSDAMYGGDGFDRIYGGTGHDTVGGGTGGDSVFGGDHNDRISGNEGNDTLRGQSGNDTIYGDENDDLLSGSSGQDYLSGGSGHDRIFGGSGNDTVSGGSGADAAWAGTGHDLSYGGTGADTLRGEQGNDTIYGQEHDDVLSGSSGNDYLNGGEDQDRLFGGSGADTLRGGEGRDTLTGGTGVDQLEDYEDTQQRDTFVVARGDTGVGEGNRDVIRGFTSGTDRIDLSDWEDLELQFGGTFSGGGGAEVLFVGGLVRIDQDGDGTADAEVEVLWVSSMQTDDFLL